MKGLVGWKSDEVIIKLDGLDELNDETVGEMNAECTYRTQLLKDSKIKDRVDEHVLWLNYVITDAFHAGIKYQREKDLK